MPSELELKEGDKAPEFTAMTNGGGRVSLSDLKGKNVVLYFYPKDNTPGCNKEACGFRDNWDAIEKKGAVVLGVSTDSMKSHDKFVEKFKLPFTLLVDEEKKELTVSAARCSPLAVSSPLAFLVFSHCSQVYTLPPKSRSACA